MVATVYKIILLKIIIFYVTLRLISVWLKMVKTKKIVPLLLLALFIGYYASTNFFIHTHNLTYGTITHSHPYTSGTHTHSINILQFIDSLTTAFFVSAGAILLLMLFSILRASLCSFYRQHTLNFLIDSHPLRAPPVVWTVIFLIDMIYVII